MNVRLVINNNYYAILINIITNTEHFLNISSNRLEATNLPEQQEVPIFFFKKQATADLGVGNGKWEKTKQKGILMLFIISAV